MKKAIKPFLVFGILFLLLTACSKTNEEEPNAPVEQPNDVEEEEEVEVEQFAAPFTGILSEEESTMRPVLATISNDPKARPQSGLSEADLIYEFIVEGNTTRYLALFQSALPNEIGPIRSSRDMFIHAAKGLDAFYVAHGYSPDALSLLQAGYVDHVNGMQHDGSLFKRSAERYAPHNSYISAENIQAAADIVNAPMTINKTPSLSFYESSDDVQLGEAASSITVKNGSHPQFTSVYAYDEDSKTYTQYRNDVETVDYGNDETVKLSNILVLEAEHQTIDAEGRQSIDLEKGGNAVLFQAGQYENVEWKNMNGTIVPVKNGATVELVPGKTWVHIIRTNPGMGTNVSHTP